MNPNDPDASRFTPKTTDRRGERDLDDLLVHVAPGRLGGVRSGVRPAGRPG
jgi:hypothetical protein